MDIVAWRIRISNSVVFCLLMLAVIFIDARVALAQEACPVPAGATPPEDPPVTAQQVEDGTGLLRDFALAVRDRSREHAQHATTVEQGLYIGCIVRQEGSVWRSGSTYIVTLTPDGRVFLHAKDMALAGRQLDPAIYGEILVALGISQSDLFSLASPDPAVSGPAFARVSAILANEPAAAFDLTQAVPGGRPGIPGASGHAAVYVSPEFGAPIVLLAGFDLGESHLVPISREAIDYGDPTVTARDVVDRESLKAFVTQAGNYMLEIQRSGDAAAASKARIALRDPNGPWRHGSVYLYVLDTVTNIITFHAAFPDRFEHRPLVPTVRDAVTGEFILPQVIAAAKSDPEGGFVEYYFDDPADDTDSAEIPKVGYAREFAGQIRRTDGSIVPVDLIVGSGFYGTAAPEAAASHGDTVIEAVLPQVMRAMTANVVEAVSGRIEQATSGAHTTKAFSFAGASTLGNVLLVHRQALESGTFDPGRLLAGSSFKLPLDGGGSGDGLFGKTALWGSGDYRNLSGGDRRSVAYDGDLVSANLGFDTRLSADTLVGMAMARSRASLNYTTSGTSKGTFTTTVTSIYPYAGWATGSIDAWIMAGHGWGEIEVEDGSGTQASDLTQRMVAVGLSGLLVSSDELIEGGRTSVRAKGEAAFTEAKVEGAGTIKAVTQDVSRQRLMVEASHTRQHESGATFTPSVEIGIRNDGGDGETGNGIEAGGGIRYNDSASGLTVAWRARTLLSHVGDHKEWGVSGLIRVDPGTDGRGLAFGVQPAWGRTASGVQQLWNTGKTWLAPQANQASGRLDAQVSYGMPVFGGDFTGTPELGLGLSEAGRDWRLGWKLALAETKRFSFNFGLEGTRWEPSNDDAEVEHRFGLTMAMRW
ncbi:MAG: autotransporter domain-containing protein [Paracoccaceae bacterium]|nr:autotransporter domain-containing protein [Paracoccaceae bacterium]